MQVCKLVFFILAHSRIVHSMIIKNAKTSCRVVELSIIVSIPELFFVDLTEVALKVRYKVQAHDTTQVMFTSKRFSPQNRTTLMRRVRGSSILWGGESGIHM